MGRGEWGCSVLGLPPLPLPFSGLAKTKAVCCPAEVDKWREALRVDSSARW